MKNISLCLIVGNCEEYIDRCLSSFAPIADEIVVVRAIGNQEPDKTLEIARDKFGAVTGEYTNAAGHEDWPHVDSFAAARQMSFDLATGKYCFWCDTDDILKSGAEIIRELAERAEYPVYIFPYDIFGRGVVVPRERMILREGGGQWKYPVHECFTFPTQVQGCQDDRVVVQHLPHLSKSGSGSRNLRILESIPKEEMTPGLWYHLHGELAGSNRIAECVEAARMALEHPDLGSPERVELLMNLARLTKKPEAKEKYLIQSYAADPTRREALGLLTCNALDKGEPKKALAFARQMIATEKPEEQSWNDRAAAYDWLGYDIFAQALRANGRMQDAERVRLQTFAQSGGPTIALVHATRGRPYQASLCRKMWLDLAEHPERIEHIFVIDADDEDSHCLQRMHHLMIAPGGGCVEAWNQGCLATYAPILVQLSDDWMPVPQWDKLIMERIGDVQKPRVLAISDGLRNDDLLCMAICTRNYWAQDYFMFHPDFTGVYSDNYFTQQAYARGQVIDAKDIVFTHNHYLKNGAEPDETYKLQNSSDRYSQGSAVLAKLNCLKSPRDWSTVPGWFNFWPYYRHVAAHLKDGDTIVEIGVWMGRSIIYLAQMLKRAGKKVRIVAIDTFKGELNQPDHQDIVRENGGSIRAAFEKNLSDCGVADIVEVIESDSAAGASHLEDGSCAMVYIDADHTYDAVKADITAWLPKVRKGGLLSGHDIQHEPVEKAVDELLPGAQKLNPVWIYAVK